MPAIDPDRLLGDLRRLAEFGRYKTGVHRPTYSAEDVAARPWIAERMAEAGLEPTIDGIGNVIGRSPRRGSAAPDRLAQRVAEPRRLARRRARRDLRPRGRARAAGTDPAGSAGRAVDVVSFADEEGHYGAFTGSRSFCGLLEEAEIDRLANRYDGTPLRGALERAGYAGRPRAQIDPERYKGFLEAHIEQGDYLESSGRKVGIVTSIVAIWQYRIRVRGRAEPCRHDAHGGAQGRGPGAGPARRGDRPALPRGRGRAHGLDHRPDHARARARRASSRAAPRCCSSSATSTRTGSSCLSARSRSWSPRPTPPAPAAAGSRRSRARCRS